ncbi:trihelix transcription factor ENAP2-like isoform X2 [Primulina eburnea]|uniref:trihelix transcription factor ENAP2-like isoform X2 n=1 Tax=Primulina eburnea TaxID=1245227 RepID=UPI003C6C9822
MLPSPTSPSPPYSATASPISDDDKHLHSPSPSPTKPELPPPAIRTPGFPTREDCWSKDATQTLIDAWGARYVELNRKNLHRKDWQEVADAVNAIHATSLKLRRTDVQCKNRIDTVKKKYKIEKSKVVQSNCRYSSTWPHFRSIDALIGGTSSKISTCKSDGHSRGLHLRVSPSPEASSSPPPPPKALTHFQMIPPSIIQHQEKDQAFSDLLGLPWSIPVGPRSKRSMKNFSVMAAAAAVMKGKEDEEEDSGAWGLELSAVGMKRKRPMGEKGTVVVEGYGRLADAIASLGKTYEKVEVAKQRQMVELEKQRMQFAKDLEIQRMKVFMESQVQFKKLCRVKHNSQSNGYL